MLIEKKGDTKRIGFYGRAPLAKTQEGLLLLTKSWSGQGPFLTRLRRAESVEKRHLYRGIESCPVCGHAQTISEFIVDGWEWSGLLFHLVEEHNANVPEEFREAIRRICKRARTQRPL